METWKEMVANVRNGNINGRDDEVVGGKEIENRDGTPDGDIAPIINLFPEGSNTSIEFEFNSEKCLICSSTDLQIVESDIGKMYHCSNCNLWYRVINND